MYAISYERKAERELLALPGEVGRRLAAAIDALSQEPRPRGCRKIVGEDRVYRIRVGRYRVIYEIRDDVLVVVIIRVAKRDDVYRGV